MKKLIALILAVILTLTCLPFSAAAKETGIEQKFRLLLEDMELDDAFSADRYLYEEKAQYPEKNPEWVLIRAELLPENSPDAATGRDGVFGNKIVLSQPYTCVPFALGYGVFDKKSNTFYDLIDAWDMGFARLHEIWNGLTVGGTLKLIGDADDDGALTILDATRIQRVLADLESEPYRQFEQLNQRDFLHGYPIGCVADYDRDGSFTIMDATKIQRHLAELPNNVEYKTEFEINCQYDTVQNKGMLVRSPKEFQDAYQHYVIEDSDRGGHDASAFDTYDDSFFQDHSLLLAYVYLPVLGHTLGAKSLIRSDDEKLTLTIDDYHGNTGASMIDPRLICLSIYNGYLNDVGSVEVLLKNAADYDLYTVNAVDVTKAAARPADPASEGYKILDYKNTIDGCEINGAFPILNEVYASNRRTETGVLAVVRSRYVLSKFLPENAGYQEKYNDAFFADNALVISVMLLSNYGYSTKLSHIAVKGDTLYAEYDMMDLTLPGVSPAGAVYYTVCEVRKSEVKNVKNTALWEMQEHQDDAVVKVIPPDDRITETAPADLNSGGYQEVSGEELTVSAPYKYDYAFSDPLEDIDTGYVMLLRSREDFEYFLPEFDNEGTLDDAFFKNYAVLAMLQHGGADEAYAILSDVAVSQDGKLWCSPQIGIHYIHYIYDNEGNPTFSPTDPVVWTFLKVRKSDVKDVESISFWKAPAYDPEKDYEYTVNDDGDVEITKYIGNRTTVSVPSSINGMKVVAIGNKAFQLSKVERVTLPDTVSMIGDKAFASCTYLSSIAIPDSVTSIGSQAFYYCSSLADLTMSKNVTSIGDYAFYACNMIESFAIPEGVTRINYATFSYCTGLKSLTMSDNVTYIGEQAFYRCNALPSIRLSSSVQTIEASAFEKCISLKSLGIPRTCKTLGAKAAKDCTALENVYFASEYYPTYVGVVIPPVENDSIGSSAFEGCTALKAVGMSYTIRTIGSRAFFGCTSLSSIDLPSSVTAISSDTFNGCESLTAVRQAGGDLTVKSVGDYAFRSCKALRNIRFTDSLTDIGDAAFRGCSSLSSLDLKENLKTIGTDAFLECTALKKLTVPKSVKTISTGALGYTVDDTNRYVKLTGFTIRGYLNSKAHTYATQNGFTFIPIDEEDEVFTTLITDDKKVAQGRYGDALPYNSLSTSTRVFTWDYQKYGDGSAFLNQPYRVAIIRSTAQYDAFFSSDHFEGIEDYAYKPINHYPLDDAFFHDNALIVGVGYFCTGDEYLFFDEIQQSDDGEVLTVRFNRYTYGDLHPNEAYEANILGYCFAAASVPKDSVKYVNAVQMLPQVKKLPNDVYSPVSYFDLYNETGNFYANFSERDEAFYVTSPQELTTAIDALMVDERGEHIVRGSYRFPVEDTASYGDAWFAEYDMIAARVFKGGSNTRLYVTDLERSASGDLLLQCTKLHDEYDNPDNTWNFIFLSIEKQEDRPNVTIAVIDEGYLQEPEKPIIYLYPEEETELTVTLGKPEELTCTYPSYNDGWHVTAKPDGTLIDESGRSYYSLYWESKSKTPVKMTDGFVVRGEDTAKFFEEKLEILGLSEREAQEFIVYWLPQMQNNEYNLIRFATREEIEEIMPLSFSVQPDTVIRVLMEYTPLDEYIDVPEQTLTTPERKGFVAVEWGGTRIAATI